MWAYSDDNIRSLASRRAQRPGGWASIPPAIRQALAHADPRRWLLTWLRHETARNELYALDDRTLADLGITQGDFPAILSGTYRRGE